MFDLKGQVAVVTAGCDGIGRAAAEALRALGATVVATSRDGATAERRTADWSDDGLTARTLTFETDETNAFFAGLAAELGGVHILVNCAAGRTAGVSVEQTDAADFAAAVESGVATAFTCSRAAVTARRDTDIRSIVNVGSIYGVLAVDHRIYDDPGRQAPIAYACAKGALVQLTRYLAAYWAPLEVRVNCVSPGGVQRDQPPAFVANYADRVPMGRMAEVGEVAGAIAYLASPASSYVTGENIMVDGGLHAW